MKTQSQRIRPSSKTVWQKIASYFRSHGIVFHICAFILFIWAALLVFMLVWGFLVSITPYRGLDGYANNKTSIIPKAIDFSYYPESFKLIKAETPYGKMVNYGGLLFNSIWLTVGSTLAKLISTVCFSYVVARYNIPGKKAIYMFVIVVMMLPEYGQTVPNFTYLHSLGLINNPAFLLSQFNGHGSGFLIYYSFFVNVDKAYEESARLDGASEMTIFFRIMVPLCMPIIGTMFLTGFIGGWNDYSTPMIFMSEYPNLALGLFNYQQSRDYQGAPAYFAGLFIAALPVATLFLIFNKQLMTNLVIGGIKG